MSIINEDASIKTRFYRKDTHTDQYLNFQRNIEHKRGVVRTFNHRTNNVVSEGEDRRKELDHIKDTLKVNGYPEWMLQNVKEKVNEEESQVVVEDSVTSDVQEPIPKNKKRRKYPVVMPCRDYLKS